MRGRRRAGKKEMEVEEEKRIPKEEEEELEQKIDSGKWNRRTGNKKQE